MTVDRKDIVLVDTNIWIFNYQSDSGMTPLNNEFIKMEKIKNIFSTISGFDKLLFKVNDKIFNEIKFIINKYNLYFDEKEFKCYFSDDFLEFSKLNALQKNIILE
ncbi:MAG: hypothetical protein PHR26_03515 [Candidatus ainarchaeum sp.]|nr:hypothetical protein [Candidatus ainarchaeum sp.]MDD3975613.1 hypothetical protein [Candidatus ainarchaeum sp.]